MGNSVLEILHGSAGERCVLFISPPKSCWDNSICFQSTKSELYQPYWLQMSEFFSTSVPICVFVCLFSLLINQAVGWLRFGTSTFELADMKSILFMKLLPCHLLQLGFNGINLCLPSLLVHKHSCASFIFISPVPSAMTW